MREANEVGPVDASDVRVAARVVDLRDLEILKEVRGRFEEIIRDAAIGMAFLALDGRYLAVNRALSEMLQRSEADLLSSTFGAITHPDDIEMSLDLMRKLRAGELDRYHLEKRYIRGDGHAVWADISVSMIRNSAGAPLCFFSQIQDVSDRKRIEHALRESEERAREAAEGMRRVDETKDTLLHAASHDLRNPLTSILGSARTLEEHGDMLPPDDREALIGIISRNARRMNRLVNDLLSFERLGRGKLEPKREPIDIGALVWSTIEEADFLKGHPVHVTAERVVVSVDAMQIEEILDNLLVNAVRYAGKDTPIWVRVSPQDGGAVLSVEDAGPGVPPEMRDAIFEPFRQGAVPNGAGVGIGLSLVAGFAKLHGGRAWVEDRPGGGASFKVFLPDEDR